MAPQAHNNEHEHEGTLSLPSSADDILFRVVRSEDAPALQRLLGRCSERTIYLRFFGSLDEFPDEKARYFAQVDGVDHFAFVALERVMNLLRNGSLMRVTRDFRRTELTEESAFQCGFQPSS